MTLPCRRSQEDHTASWSIATLDARSDSMHVAGGTVLATGTHWFDAGRRSESTGLLAFDEAGQRAFTRFRGRKWSCSGAAGGSGMPG